MFVPVRVIVLFSSVRESQLRRPNTVTLLSGLLAIGSFKNSAWVKLAHIL